MKPNTANLKADKLEVVLHIITGDITMLLEGLQKKKNSMTRSWQQTQDTSTQARFRSRPDAEKKEKPNCKRADLALSLKYRTGHMSKVFCLTTV